MLVFQKQPTLELPLFLQQMWSLVAHFPQHSLDISLLALLMNHYFPCTRQLRVGCFQSLYELPLIVLTVRLEWSLIPLYQLVGSVQIALLLVISPEAQ